MRRWLWRATFSLILLTLPVWAQRHGGGGGGGGAHFASRGGSAVHSSGSFHGGNVGRSSSVHLRIGNPYYPRRSFYGQRGYYPYYPYAAYYPYYGSYSDPLYDSNDQDSYAEASNPAPYAQDSPQDSGLQRDVQALNGKIDRLQADVEARNHPKTEMEPATALVFRDKHVEEVRNYAISGGTLWVLNESAAKKIPLAQLDLDATVKMNDDRGVDFQVPGPAISLQIVR
ncbi:MAG: hypothetical protein WBZ01_07975 [Terriglobales bacterium]|jgi:hypothetical protein